MTETYDFIGFKSHILPTLPLPDPQCAGNTKEPTLCITRGPWKINAALADRKKVQSDGFSRIARIL